MKKTAPALVVLIGIIVIGSAPAPNTQAQPYPITWELKIRTLDPKRIAVAVPGSSVPKAYWYLTYTVTNDSDQEQTFLPVFRAAHRRRHVTAATRTFPSASSISSNPAKATNFSQAIRASKEPSASARIRRATALPSGRNHSAHGHVLHLHPGTLRRSHDRQRSENKDIVLRKTLQLEYQIRGDEIFPARTKSSPKASLDHAVNRAFAFRRTGDFCRGDACVARLDGS